MISCFGKTLIRPRNNKTTEFTEGTGQKRSLWSLCSRWLTFFVQPASPNCRAPHRLPAPVHARQRPRRNISHRAHRGHRAKTTTLHSLCPPWLNARVALWGVEQEPAIGNYLTPILHSGMPSLLQNKEK